MKVYTLNEYNNYISISEEFISYLSNSPLNEDVSQGDYSKSSVKKIIGQIKTKLGLDLGFISTFSAGITAFVPIADSLMKRENIEITTETVVLSAICALATIYISYKEDAKARKDARNMLTELKLMGVGNGIIKNLKEVYKSSFNVVQTIGKYTGKVINTFVDMFSYTIIMIPVMNAINYFINKHSLSFDMAVENILGLTIGIGIVASKYIFVDFIDKLKAKFKNKKKIEKYEKDIIDKGFKEEYPGSEKGEELIHEDEIKTFKDFRSMK